ncbi:isochorismate synthase [Paeniglutamicibacter psychrophenolicus]|uniref:isochorismate synthase n=1 Tax=Paeniglutamicibacter psychrophenolicus TaxID=257454 RepID=UPI0027898797|nr:isochorismate synthase [Paeniglutamicibacter psychrophenolicus]MDQ0095738.1 menaquinone-specific isochorismate synthase [Paeniglutamicibacter psychrophenolicus]
MTSQLSAAVGTPVPGTVPLLRSITVQRPAMSEHGLLDYITRDDSLVWSRHGEGTIGFGQVARFESTGPERFALAHAWWDAVSDAAQVSDPLDLPGTGLIAFGAFAFSFSSTYSSRLIVPRIVVGRNETCSWITYTVADPETELSAEAAEAELADLLEDYSPEHELGEGLDRLVAGQISEQEYKDSVRKGVAVIESGAATKLVLARDAVAELASPIAVAQVLRQLVLRYDDCWTYSVDGLIGATPEMLVRVRGEIAEARVLAGTLDRATAPSGDSRYAHRMLIEDEKQRHEHQLAIDSLTEQLGPLSSGMDAPDEPFVLQLPNVWHLASDVKASLAARADGSVPSVLDLAEVFHPTAAVCGTPTKEAGRILRELEGMDRGPYAGPVGWIDTRGNGEFGIALRGGVIESPTSVRLYAGCGVVAASDPVAELAESWAKMRPMREALGI